MKQMAQRQVVTGVPRPPVQNWENKPAVQQPIAADMQGDVQKVLEQGTGDNQAAKAVAQNQQQFGWKHSVKTQLGIRNDPKVQQRLTEVRRNLEKEIAEVRHKKEVAEQQTKEQEEQILIQKKQTVDEHRTDKNQSRIKQMLGLGKGERRGTKGK